MMERESDWFIVWGRMFLILPYFSNKVNPQKEAVTYSGKKVEFGVRETLVQICCLLLVS